VHKLLLGNALTRCRPPGLDLAYQGAVTDTLPSRVLVVEDERSIRDTLADLFDADGTSVESAGTLDEAKAVLATHPFDLIVTDIRLGGRRDGGLQVMAVAGFLSPDACVIALTAYPDDDYRHASLRLGATHFLEKPVPLERIAELASRAGVPTAITPASRTTAMGMARWGRM
jgi:DNA-binding NtrC family response regulator